MRFMLALGLIFFSSTVRVTGQPPAKVVCTAADEPYEVVDAKTGKAETKDNWIADCKIVRGDDELYSTRLPLSMGATFRDAMEAIDDFRVNKAPEILKEMGK